MRVYIHSRRGFLRGGVVNCLSGFLINTFLIHHRNENMVVDIIEKGRNNILMIFKNKMINKIVLHFRNFGRRRGIVNYIGHIDRCYRHCLCFIT